jgi:folate-binding protein YgfZ
VTTATTARTALRLTGRDCLALLHRVSSNALLDLPEGGVRATLFCDFRGRLLHRAHVLHAPGGAVWLLRGDAAGGPLAAFVDRHVFRDDVTLDDRTDAFAWTIDGVTWDAPLPEHERIATGRPRHGAEIAEAFNPYEVNLAHEVHLAKGCYTGQEALQRLVTYDSVRRRLVRFEGGGATPTAPQDVLEAGAGEGRAAGVLTSAAPRPGGGWIALSPLRHDATGPLRLADGTVLGEPFEFPGTRPQGRP